MVDYRKEALEQLHTDSGSKAVLVIAKPPTAISVFLLTIIIIMLIAWLFFGKVTQREQGKGILISENGLIYDAVTQQNGLVVKVLVAAGDRVQKNQILVELERLDLKNQIESVQTEVNLLELEQQRLQADYKKESTVYQQHFKEQQQALKILIKLQRMHLRDLNKSLPERKKMANKGIVSKIVIEDQVRIYNQVIESLNKNIAELINIKSELIKFNNEWQQRLLDNEQELLAKHVELNKLSKEYELATKVLSPISGIVTSIKTTPGKYVKEATAMVAVSQAKDDLQAPASRGIVIKAGMSALVEPAGIEPETYGAIKAQVQNIQSYPASKQTIVSILQNEQLADGLLEQEKSLILVRLNLIKDKTTPSGYTWSSGTGYPGLIHAGSLCKGQVIIQSQSPISLIIPALRKITGLSP